MKTALILQQNVFGGYNTTKHIFSNESELNTHREAIESTGGTVIKITEIEEDLCDKCGDILLSKKEIADERCSECITMY